MVPGPSCLTDNQDIPAYWIGIPWINKMLLIQNCALCKKDGIHWSCSNRKFIQHLAREYCAFLVPHPCLPVTVLIQIASYCIEFKLLICCLAFILVGGSALRAEWRHRYYKSPAKLTRTRSLPHIALQRPMMSEPWKTWWREMLH